MTTTLSSKGQVVLPKAARNKLQLRSGTTFTCQIRGDSIILTPQNLVKSRPKAIKDPKTGLIITQAPAGHTQVSSKQVHASLIDFP